MIKKYFWNLLYVLADSKLENTDIGIGLPELFESMKISNKFSEKTFDNSLLWLSAKETSTLKSSTKSIKHIYDTELLLVYYNWGAFINDYTSGKIEKDFKLIQLIKKNYFYTKFIYNNYYSLKIIIILYKFSKLIVKSFFGSKGIKVIIAFQSVWDSLYNNDSVSREMYDKFLIKLTVAYEFDYIELKATKDFFTLVSNINQTLEKKSSRKDLLMWDTYVGSKGAKTTKRATMEGFNDMLSKYWINMLMSIPGVSENKAIAIAK